MALIQLWKNSPEQLKGKHLQQIIAFAGTGKLRDNSETSRELREYLAIISPKALEGYAEDCLRDSFADSGLALQDVVNEIGRRLGYSVKDGRYQGRSGEIGFDGIWTSKEGHSIVVEVKTTDAYRIDLGTIAGYQRKLSQSQAIDGERSSILIVVGRKDTGDLEAQIRGSRYAWDIRLISVDAIARLMHLKHEIDDPQIIKKIGDILIPREFTRLDEIIELVFSTAEDVRKEIDIEPVDLPITEAEASKAKLTEPKFVPVSFHEASIERIQKKMDWSLIKQSRAIYATPDFSKTVLCVVSKQHERSSKHFYWYAFHPHQKETLERGEEAFVAFGCGSADSLILIPLTDFEPWLVGLNQTIGENKRYWHVHISKDKEGAMTLERKRDYENIDVSKYVL